MMLDFKKVLFEIDRLEYRCVNAHSSGLVNNS